MSKPHPADPDVYIPVIDCERHGTRWRFWCGYCRRYHYHSPEPGHRVAHCDNRESPYVVGGYILKGPA